ncbi:MAG: hypothetical protein K2X49_08725 [Acetobacteraceae bacterium]|nr:hypothetical protein [Acetobacteraceae bacterium]
MLTRTRLDLVVFRRPFHLRGEEAACPAGTWVVQTEEDLLQSLSFPAWRRTATTIRLRDAPPGRTLRTIPVDPVGLAAALTADAVPA